MSNAVVTKQGKPSKPGEKVDTNAAEVMPPASDEVVAEAAKHGDSPIIEKNIRPAAAKGKSKAKAAKAKPANAKPRGTGNGSGPVARLTAEWLSTKNKDVKVKDQVKLPGGTVIDVIGRWTKRKGDTLIPMVTGRIVSGAPQGKKKGDRHNAVAAEATHVK